MSMKTNIGKTVTEKVIRMSAIVIMAVLFVVLFFLFVNGFDSYSDAGFIYSFANKAERIFLAGLALLFFGFLYHIVGLFLKKCTLKSIKYINLGMWTVFVLIQAFFLFYIRSYYKWDSGFVIGAAASLAEQKSVAKEAYYYLSVYPNQNLFVFLTAVLVRLANLFNIPVADRPLLFNTCNTILMDLSLILLISILKKFHKESLFGKKIRSEQEREVLLCRMRFMLFCNPFLYLGVSYYYTITLSWIFTMGFLRLLFDENENVEAIPAGGASAVDPALFQMLKDLRKQLSKKVGLPPYVIFQDVSLEAMSSTYPVTIEELQNIPGVGQGKAQKFGAEFCELIKRHCEENEIERPSDLRIRTVANKSKLKVSIIHSIDRLVDLDDIARTNGMEFDELLDEIEAIVYSGTKINIDYFLKEVMDDDKLKDIYEYFKESETDSVDIALDELGEDYSEEDIRLVRIKFLSEVAN